jgi:hypothetical protein
MLVNDSDRISALAELQSDLNKEVFIMRQVVAALLQKLPQEEQYEIMNATGFRLIPMEHD